VDRLPDSALVARNIARCRMVMCAAPAYIKRHGMPGTVQELRERPRLTFSESVSPGDWTLVDSRGRSHSIDGPSQLLANNMELLLAAALDGIGIGGETRPTPIVDRPAAARGGTALERTVRLVAMTAHGVLSKRSKEHRLPPSAPGCALAAFRR